MGNTLDDVFRPLKLPLHVINRRNYHQTLPETINWNMWQQKPIEPLVLSEELTTSSSEAKEVAYKTLVWPHMEYGVCITDPST